MNHFYTNCFTLSLPVKLEYSICFILFPLSLLLFVPISALFLCLLSGSLYFCPVNAPTPFSLHYSPCSTLCPLQVEYGGAQPTVPPGRASVAPAELVGAGLPRSSLPQRPALQKHHL